MDVNSASPTPPYASWATAATRIQDAQDATQPAKSWFASGITKRAGG
ncbi:MAG: hypothetical protein U1F83_10755 [Verrucomicrobiota bacterium]